jgi:hypothetical protein
MDLLLALAEEVSGNIERLYGAKHIQKKSQAI